MGGGEPKRKRANDVVVACVQTLLISFQRGSPSVGENLYRRRTCLKRESARRLRCWGENRYVCRP